MTPLRIEEPHERTASTASLPSLYPKPQTGWALTLCVSATCLAALAYVCLASLPIYTVAHQALVFERGMPRTAIGERFNPYAVVYLFGKDRADVRVGSAAKLSFDTGFARNGLVFDGRVSNISNLPISPAEINAAFGMQDAAYEITIELSDLEPSKRDSFTALPGKFCTVKFVVEEWKLIDWMFRRFE